VTSCQGSHQQGPHGARSRLLLIEFIFTQNKETLFERWHMKMAVFHTAVDTDRRVRRLTASIITVMRKLRTNSALDHPDGGGSKHLWNVGQFLLHCTAQQPSTRSSPRAERFAYTRSKTQTANAKFYWNSSSVFGEETRGYRRSPLGFVWPALWRGRVTMSPVQQSGTATTSASVTCFGTGKCCASQLWRLCPSRAFRPGGGASSSKYV
jgi:hypothetical protein